MRLCLDAFAVLLLLAPGLLLQAAYAGGVEENLLRSMSAWLAMQPRGKMRRTSR